MNKNFAIIRKIEVADKTWDIATGRISERYKMGKLEILHSPATPTSPEFLSVTGGTKLPSWDEMVWIRYKLCSADSDMAFILPKLEEYINYDSGAEKFVLTMEAVDRTRTHGE